MDTLPLLTVKQAAKVIGICPSLVRRYCNDGRLPAQFLGVWLIFKSDAEDFAKHPRLPGRPPKHHTGQSGE